MIPGMNPRQMKQAMKRMGIQQEEIAAQRVVISLENQEIVINNPSIQKVNMMGQWTYQISGEETIQSKDVTPEITDEDIQTIMDQTNCSKEEAQKAIEESKGDLAQAILKLSE